MREVCLRSARPWTLGRLTRRGRLDGILGANDGQDGGATMEKRAKPDIEKKGGQQKHPTSKVPPPLSKLQVPGPKSTPK